MVRKVEHRITVRVNSQIQETSVSSTPRSPRNQNRVTFNRPTHPFKWPWLPITQTEETFNNNTVTPGPTVHTTATKPAGMPSPVTDLTHPFEWPWIPAGPTGVRVDCKVVTIYGFLKRFCKDIARKKGNLNRIPDKLTSSKRLKEHPELFFRCATSSQYYTWENSYSPKTGGMNDDIKLSDQCPGDSGAYQVCGVVPDIGIYKVVENSLALCGAQLCINEDESDKLDWTTVVVLQGNVGGVPLKGTSHDYQPGEVGAVRLLKALSDLVIHTLGVRTPIYRDDRGKGFYPVNRGPTIECSMYYTKTN
eukprot:sb/3467207/